MKKKQIEKSLNYIMSTIDEYINNGEEYPRIDILDGDSRQYVKRYKDYNQSGYSGITSKYIRRYLFNNKYSSSLIHTALIKLLNNGKVTVIYCPDIKAVVWESDEGINKGNYYLDLEPDFTDRKLFINVIRDYKGVMSYLNN